MPKVKSNEPESLQPYLSHGIDLSWGKGDKDAIGTCPWCDKPGKFYVNLVKGTWRCWVCGEGNEKGGGNSQVFIELLWKKSKELTTTKMLKELADERGYDDTKTLVAWGICKSILTGEWLVPGFDRDGNIRTVYRRGANGTLYPTKTLGHWIHGANLYRKGRKKVIWCEGPWDGMAIYETLGKISTTAFEPAPNALKSMRKLYNVLAAPGCETLDEKWLKLFKGKEVLIAFDNDHPRKHSKTGKEMEPAGWKAVQRISPMISRVAKKVEYIKWGEDEYYDLSLPNGCDVRDWLVKDGIAPS